MVTARPNSFNWLWIASLWAGLAILYATQTVFAMRHEGMHHAWVKLFTVLTLDWLPWVLVTPWVISLARRYPPAWKSPRTWLLHLGAPVAIEIIAIRMGIAAGKDFSAVAAGFRLAGILEHLAGADLRRPRVGVHFVCRHSDRHLCARFENAGGRAANRHGAHERAAVATHS